ncbi:MAG: LTA synthase family protein [Lachnospiraceae bacterium]|nr:LTA synthase family protein [Lachnospiraceae bacterium]
MNEKKQENRLIIFIVMALPFILMDLALRFFARGIHYFRQTAVFSAIMFTVIWIVLIIGIVVMIGGWPGRIIYLASFAAFFTMYLANAIYFNLTSYFFSFNLAQMAGEGGGYVGQTMLSTSPLIYVFAAPILIVFFYSLFHIKKRDSINVRGMIVLAAAFLVIHFFLPLFYGKKNSGLEWDTWRNARNVYENFNDSNKDFIICGFYEYTVRDAYMTYLKAEGDRDPQELAQLEQIFSVNTEHPKNDCTGMFEGKNLIILQLEGLDSWLLDRETTPTLYRMQQEGINFSRHYSFYNGGGSTFNSEMAVNIGYVTPMTYTKNGYSFSTNHFPYSMPRLFKKAGYEVNAFHMNTREYYSRGINYENWGFDSYRGLMDEHEYADDDLSRELDRELILDEGFYDGIFKHDKPFVDYIITYTPHTPFSADSSLGRYLAQVDGISEFDMPTDEEGMARLYAKETDHFVELLLQGLEDNGLLEDTVIVAFADHYLYTLTDQTIVIDHKHATGDLINRTPMIIWQDGTTPHNVGKINSQVDILPTLLNLYGIKYREENYVGSDIFDPGYEGCVFFPDKGYLDKNGFVQEGTEEGMALIRKNDYVLKYDYFREIKDSSD